MTDKESTARRRLGPRAATVGVAIVVLQLLAAFGAGIVAPATFIQFFGMLAGPGIGLLLLLGWWLWVSPDRWPDRLLAVALPFVGFFLAGFLAHPSAYQAIYTHGVPIFCLAFLGWALSTSRWSAARRRLALVAVTVVACGAWTLVRTTGVDGDLSTDFEPRWAATAEERFLRSQAATATVAPDAEWEGAGAAWPGLRGPARDGVLSGVRIGADWSAAPPEVVWRHPVGPGWSSFAVAGDRLFTQEQRGDDEVVVSYVATTGEPAWVHSDPARFWEAMAGTGPRATPTLSGGKVFALGATGLVNALDAADGSPLWQRDLAADTGAAVPEWGFSSSPLVIDGLVVVHGGAPDGKAVVAYDAATGEPRWFAPAGALSYSSVQAATLAGERQLLMLTGDGLTSLAPADGAVLWDHGWPVQGASRIVQPAILAGGDVLIGTGFGVGLRRIAVSHDGDGWQTETRWTSTAMNPYFNDLVIHRGHVYGFDGRILACVDLATGERKWKGGRYGNGQLLLLPDQDLLLVLSDRGDLALVKAEPAAFSELARFHAIDGKTWNHPALVDGVVYVRNAEEMAAVRLPDA